MISDLFADGPRYGQMTEAELEAEIDAYHQWLDARCAEAEDHMDKFYEDEKDETNNRP